MLVVTTNNIEGKPVKEYKGLVFGEVITGVNFIRDFGAGLRDFFGGRSKGYENELLEARDSALNEMVSRAQGLGANAIIGASLDYEVLGANGSMMMVICRGTAVLV